MTRLVIVALSLWMSALIIRAERPIKVSSPGGTYLGRIRTSSSGTDYQVFRGIPYAQPPVGHLRFRKPKPMAKLDVEFEAVEERSYCPQMYVLPSEFGPGSEDCLYLNVFAPVLNPGSSLKKVFVFIHGGGNINGMKDFYVPETMVADNDIIVVTINYRIGLLGFLSSMTSSARGNYGLWDQVEALRWVKANIEGFGGDPNDVTVGGESAGGFDTSALSVCSQAAGLFTKLFPMSGVLGAGDNVIMGDPLPVTLAFARREKCLPEGDPSPENDEEWSQVVECLRKLPTERFSSAEGLGELPMIGPCIDQDYFPKPLGELLSDHDYLESIDFHQRDYLVSVCYNEGDVFTILQETAKSTMTDEQINALPQDAMFHGLISSTLANTFGQLHPEVISHIAQWYEENYEISPVADFAADAYFHIPTTEYINAISRMWPEGESRLRYLRFVNFPEFLTGPYQGTVHGIDLIYLFDIDPQLVNKVVDYKANSSLWNASDDDLKKQYIHLVTSFIKTGQPLAKINDPSFEWPAYTESEGDYLEFNSSPRVLQHLKSDRMELFQHTIPAWIEEFSHTVDNHQTHATDEL